MHDLIFQYTTVDEAVAARRLLHGKRWPLSNPNILRVEYSTQEEVCSFAFFSSLMCINHKMRNNCEAFRHMYYLI